MRTAPIHVLFAGGGTAGHLFPGLAVAEELLRAEPEVQITFAGSGKPFEVEYTRRAGHEHVAIPCRPFSRSPIGAFRFLTANLNGFYAARRLLAEHPASVVVGLGGYASVPAVRAAARAGIPYVLLEQNAVPGRATRWLAPGASLICSALEGIRPRLRRGCRVRVTGNPLRRGFVDRQLPARGLRERIGRRRRLVVLGGSGGSQELNQNVPLALYKAGAALHDWQIVHQTGEHNAAATGYLYRKLGIRATVSPFIERLPEVLRDSHLAISRAGGTTLAELAACGVPAILLPLGRATDNHQRCNADVFAEAGAAKILDRRELAGRLDDHVARAIVELAGDQRLRANMAQSMTSLARPRATVNVARAIVKLLEFRELAAAC